MDKNKKGDDNMNKTNKINNKKGSGVIQTLIVIAIMGGLAVTMLASINKTIINKTNATNEALLGSQKIDVDKLINGTSD